MNKKRVHAEDAKKQRHQDRREKGKMSEFGLVGLEDDKIIKKIHQKKYFLTLHPLCFFISAISA